MIMMMIHLVLVVPLLTAMAMLSAKQKKKKTRQDPTTEEDCPDKNTKKNPTTKEETGNHEDWFETWMGRWMNNGFGVGVAIFSLCPPTPCMKPVKERHAGGIAFIGLWFDARVGTLEYIFFGVCRSRTLARQENIRSPYFFLKKP